MNSLKKMVSIKPCGCTKKKVSRKNKTRKSLKNKKRQYRGGYISGSNTKSKQGNRSKTNYSSSSKKN